MKAGVKSEVHEVLGDYYRGRFVRERMMEFLGQRVSKTPAAIYITASDGYSDFGLPAPPHALSSYLEKDWEVARSLWDSDGLIADLDLDYENFDSAEAAYLDPLRTLKLVEPVFAKISQVLADMGIHPISLVGGRGLHLVWHIPRGSRAFRRLAGIGQVPSSLMPLYANAGLWDRAGVDLEQGCAFAGLGMVLEWVAHLTLLGAADYCSVPIQITAVEVGPGDNGREIVAIDLSEYGDPLHRRHLRLPFSAYLKPRKLIWAIGRERVRSLLPIFQIPLAGMELSTAVTVMRSPEQTRTLARDVSVEIPDQSEGMLSLIAAYSRSALADFHKRFYSVTELEAHRSVARKIASVYGALPHCVRWILDNPNDWLLKPTALQHVVRVLTALEWRPREIAGLIRSRYESDCDWGNTWTRHDPSWRAIFYARLFGGLIATGTDRLIDFNCVSHQEKRYCTNPDCAGNLLPYGTMICNRSNYE
jgi:hypothetical protein